MSGCRGETYGKFSCCFVNAMCAIQCQLSYLALTASEKSSSPLRRDVRAQSRNHPGARDGWQTSCREENQHAAGSWRSIICQGQFVFLPLAVDVQRLFLRALGRDMKLSCIPSFYTRTQTIVSDIHRVNAFVLVLSEIHDAVMKHVTLSFVICFPTCTSCRLNWEWRTMFDLYSWRSRAAAAVHPKFTLCVKLPYKKWLHAG